MLKIIEIKMIASGKEEINAFEKQIKKHEKKGYIIQECGWLNMEEAYAKMVKKKVIVEAKARKKGKNAL